MHVEVFYFLKLHSYLVSLLFFLLFFGTLYDVIVLNKFIESVLHMLELRNVITCSVYFIKYKRFKSIKTSGRSIKKLSRYLLYNIIFWGGWGGEPLLKGRPQEGLAVWHHFQKCLVLAFSFGMPSGSSLGVASLHHP